MKKDVDYLKGIYIAHRGLHNIKKGIPENSLLAFEEAIKINRAIEFDLHILRDNNIVVFHDDNLKRVTGVNKPICEYTYDEIKDLKLLGTDQKIPLFVDVLKLVDGKVLIDIEFKYDVKTGLLEKEASELLDDYKGKFIVKSFNPSSVKWFKENRPDFVRGQLSSGFTNDKMNFIKRFVLKNMLLNCITDPDFIAYDINNITKSQANKIRKKNLPLLLWTIRTKEQLNEAKKIGDSFIYENIEL